MPLPTFQVLDWNNKGLSIGGEYLNHLRLTDEILLKVNNPAELQELQDDRNTASNEIGLKINLVKTKIMYNELVGNEEITMYNTALETIDD